MVEENVMYQQLQNFVRRKFVAWKHFGQIWKNYPLHLKNCVLQHLWSCQWKCSMY